MTAQKVERIRVAHGHRQGDIAVVLRETTYSLYNEKNPMKIVCFDDGETFGYPTQHVRTLKD